MEVTVRKVGLKVGVMLSFLVMLTVNALAVLLPINGVSTGAAADRYPNLFTPAPITFSIWGLIYLMLAIYVIVQLWPARGSSDSARQALLAGVAKMFILTSVLNAGWIFAWHYQQMLLSLVIMLLLLLGLIRIGWLLRKPHGSFKEELALRIPFGLYFGWITVATIANATVWLVSIGWDGFGLPEARWMEIIVLVGILIAGVTMYRNRNAAYGVAVLWAYAGILNRHLSSQWYGGTYTLVIVATSVAFGVLLMTTLVTAVRGHRGKA